MDNKIEIRPLRKEDSMDQLILLSKEFFKEYEFHHEYFFKIDVLNNEDILKYFSNWLNNDDKVALVATVGNRIVGYITVYIMNQPNFWEIKQIGHISGLMVEKSYRHKGIGSKLFSAAIDFLKKKQVNYYTLFTAENNIDAIQFYKRNGMTPLYTHLIGCVD